jgi:hypothetical protein
LSDLEEGVLESGIANELRDFTKRVPNDQLALGLDERQHNHLKEELSKIDTDNITPIEALRKLSDLKKFH